jgi:hypothetical protein
MEAPTTSPRKSEPDRRDDAPEGLFLARSGTWYHDGDRIAHQRLAALLSKSVARTDDGKLVVTTGRDVLPMVSEDAPYRVRTLAEDAVVLLDDSREPLTPSSVIAIDTQGRVRSVVKGGKAWALWSASATQVLGQRVDDDGMLAVPGGRVEIQARDGEDWAGVP